MTRVSKISLVFILAGLGGLIRQVMVSQFGQLGLLACNYGAVYGLVRMTVLPHPNQTLTTGISVGFFGGLSSIAPILQQLAQALVVGDWLGFLGLFVLHVLGGYGVAILAHGRAVKGTRGGQSC